MLLDQKSELELRATRPKPLVISLLVHLLLIALIAFNPDWFETSSRRKIRIAGEDFDISQLEIHPLTLPPRMPAPPQPVPLPAPAPPAVQAPQQATPPPPPPPPPRPAPPPPDRVIRPDDLLAEGARPDGSPRASRGDTRDQARAGAARDAQQAQQAQEEQKAREAQQAQRGASDRSEKAAERPPNTNPNALSAPSSLLSLALRKAEADVAALAQRSGQAGHTGILRGDNNGTYSAEPQILSPNPKGIDFGPYLNSLLTKLRNNWLTVMPEMARLGQQGRVDIIFSVARDGGVKDLQVVVNSGYEALDKGALSAIQLSNPFQRLPAEYETDLKLRIAFLYNLNP